jgi:SAM-dependent methyltransferase
MKNKKFFYQQYSKIHWENQEKTKINSIIYNFIIQNFILKKKTPDIKIFDIGFGIGFFLKMLYSNLIKFYKYITLEGCEPSDKNYNHFLKNSPNVRKNVRLKTYKKPFLDVKTNEKFDFITAIYVFTHFVLDDAEKFSKEF